MRPNYRLLLYVLAVVGFAADQASKYGIFHWLRDAPGYRQEVVPGTFDLVAQRITDESGAVVLHVNQGALFGLGQSAAGTANALFALISLLAAGAIVFWSLLPSTAGDRKLCLALGLILAGTLGNLYDRVLFGGVRDFMHFFIERGGQRVFDWPVFNVADCCLVLGAGLLLLQAFQAQPRPEEETDAPGNAAAPAASQAQCVAATQSK